MSQVYNAESYEITQEELMKPIREITKSRKIFPISTIASPSDLKAYYFKQVDDHNLSYDMEVFQSPRSESSVQKLSQEIPVLHGEIQYSWDELQRINKGKLPVDERSRNLSFEFARQEDRIALNGDAKTGITSVLTTGTNSTAAVEELNVTTYGLATSSLTAQLGEMIDNLEDIKTYPLKLVVTPDVYKKAMTVTNGAGGEAGDKTALEKMEELLLLHGGPNSEVIMSKYLGGTFTESLGKGSFAAGTTNSALFAYSKNFYEIIASPIEQREKPVNKVDGLYLKFVERWVPLFKEKLAIIYGATAVIA